jgi:1-deoxy-D-xylulose-5-phosphate reductoisomerase
VLGVTIAYPGAGRVNFIKFAREHRRPPLRLRKRMRIALLGSTGSIGRSTLDVVRSLGHEWSVAALAAGRNWKELATQVEEFHPRLVSVADDETRRQLLSVLPARAHPEQVLTGGAGLLAVAGEGNLVVAALVGAVGLPATLEAASRGVRLALANKEALVVAGSLVMDAAARGGAEILPVDSEHSAIHQCLRAGVNDPGDADDEVRRLILTASGGPFLRASRAELEHVTPEQALRHPTWKMGRRISADSATLMNKGFEIIEACHLFGVAESQVEVAIHPQSVVHSLVEFRDGSVIAQLGTADMRVPIQYALTYPQRLSASWAPWRFDQMAHLDFEAPDVARFPCLRIARDAFIAGEAAPAILNAADEVAVEAFFAGRIRFTQIASLVEETLERVGSLPASTLDEVLAADAEARRRAHALVETGVSA